MTPDLTSDPRLKEVIYAVLVQLSPLLQTPKLSPSLSDAPTGSPTYEAHDFEAAEAAHRAEGNCLRQARISRESAQQAADAKATADQLAAKRARKEQLKSDLIELESEEASAAEQYARHQALASAKRLALSQQYNDL